MSAHSTDQPWRYIGHYRPMPLWLSLATLLRTGKWRRTELEFEAIAPGDPRYEEAPYEGALLCERHPPGYTVLPPP